jgi:uncharacterized protein YkwD
VRVWGLAALFLLTGAAGSGAAPSPAVPSLQQGVLVEINHVRAEHGLRPVRLSRPLSVAAASHSLEMARRGYFNHSSADGTLFWRRIRRYYRLAKFRRWSVGENLLWATPTVGAARALQMWMASPTHRANILKARWREIGISAVHVEQAPGFFAERPVTIITTDFGRRR